jgi:hypothetical protein
MSERFDVPKQLRGIYVLYRCLSKTPTRSSRYEVQYVGMTATGARDGIRGRLKRHARSRRKEKRCTHFSVFEVWDNIRDDEIAELEGLFRYIYRKDPEANALNKQRGFKKMKLVESKGPNPWRE